MQDVKSQYLSMTECGALCGVCAGTITEWSAQGYFPPRRFFGKKVVYLKSEIEEWFASGAHLRAEPLRRGVEPAPGYRHGETHHRSKWPDAFVAQCVRLHADGVPLDAIAALLRMPRVTVHRYITGARRRQPA